MHVRRIADGLRRQDWLTVSIEFLLVIFGVLVALQVNNWNTARIHKKGADNILNRLRSEVTVNIAAIDDRINLLEGAKPIRIAGLDALRSCDGSPEATEKLSNALGNMISDFIPSFVDNSMRELTRQDRYLDLMSNEFRNALNIYSAQLSDERDQLNINYGLMWDQHVIKHPLVGMVIPPSNDVVDFKFSVNAPIESLCQNTVFQRQLALTETWHQSTVLRLRRFKGWSEDFLKEIDGELKIFER